MLVNSQMFGGFGGDSAMSPMSSMYGGAFGSGHTWPPVRVFPSLRNFGYGQYGDYSQQLFSANGPFGYGGSTLTPDMMGFLGGR
ncbi:hypothetical protein Q1695_016203 [Nippostrongylus brasiliensis]|nr:hypothetical protein Q1695_016203 [Nippostrongylus brasiliensis]